MRRFVAVAPLALLLFAADVAAHPGGSRRLHDVQQEIQKDPRNASLYLRRADLQIERGDLRAARRDIGRAREIRPALDEIDLVEGLLLIESREWDRAKRVLTQFLDRHPRHAKARVLRAQAHRATAQPLRAAADMRIAFEADPIPAHALDAARDLVTADQPDEAIRMLERAVAQIGPNVVLVDLGVEIERERKRWDSAIEWFDHMPPKLQGSPLGLKRRGDLLADAGRSTDAHRSYQQALDALARLPAARRRTPKFTVLEAELRRLVGASKGDPNAD